MFIEITELRLLKAPFDWISDFEEHTLNGSSQAGGNDKIPSGNLLHSYWKWPYSEFSINSMVDLSSKHGDFPWFSLSPFDGDCHAPPSDETSPDRSSSRTLKMVSTSKRSDAMRRVANETRRRDASVDVDMTYVAWCYGHLSVISTNKTPFIECIITIITTYNW